MLSAKTILYSPICRPKGCQPILYAILFAVIACSSSAARAQSGQFTGHVIRVETGDRIVARLQTWNVTIQLHGISCPTTPNEAALRAQEYTSLRVLGSDIKVTVRGTGPHETIYGEVRTYDKKSLNEELVSVGLAYWAKAYAPNREDIALLESEARAGRRGIWGEADGSNVSMPPTPPPPVPVVFPTPEPTQSPTPRAVRRARRRHATPTPAAVSLAPVTPPLPTQAHKVTAQAGTSQRAIRISLVSIFGFAIFAGAAALATQLILAGGLHPTRLPYQAGVALCVGVAAGLIAPFPIIALSHHIALSHATLASAVIPPLIALCAWSSTALCRREQILRAAPNLALGDQITDLSGLDLVKASGQTRVLPDRSPFISQVGKIPAVYLRESTYSYDAVQSEAYYSRRKKRGRRNTKYQWTPVYQETSKSEFVIMNANGGTALIDGSRAAYMPLRIARFYNEVPVESWFTRPYPGDTRTEIEFIGTDSPVVIWGRPHRVSDVNTHKPTLNIGDDAFHNLLVVEGDEARIWSKRPLLGLLLMLISLGLTLFLLYGLSTPGALGTL